MLRPLLEFSSREPIMRRGVVDAIADHFGLTQDEREARIQSGATYVRNRVGWSMTFLTKAGLIEKVAPRTYAITERGREFLRSHPDQITEKDLKAVPGWFEAWKTTRSESAPESPEHSSGVTPLEALDNATDTLNADLKSRLLTTILEQSPAFFEQLVLDVLVAMGYGGSRERGREAGAHG